MNSKTVLPMFFLLAAILLGSCQSIKHMSKDSQNLLVGEFEFTANGYFSGFDGPKRDGITLRFENIQTKQKYMVVTQTASGIIYVENLPEGMYRFTEMVLTKERFMMASDIHSGLVGYVPSFSIKNGQVNVCGKIDIRWEKKPGQGYNHHFDMVDEIKQHFSLTAPESEYLGWDWQPVSNYY